MYFVCDVYDSSDKGKIMDYKDLRNLYIDELYHDTIDNYSEKEIVVFNVKEFVNLARSDTLPNIDDLKDYLESYGWKIIDLLQIQRDLEDIKNYFKGKLEYYGKIDEVINIINKGVK